MTRAFSSRVFRFAPSPNGHLHLGHAYSALLNFRLARDSAGRLLLRIENIDLDRCRREFEEGIFEDLRWLGMEWETPVRRQSEHFCDYARALASLSSRGLTYPCFCSRRDILEAVAGKPGWPVDPDGSPLYPGICKGLSEKNRQRRLAAGEPASLRIDMAAALAQLTGPLEWLEASRGDKTTFVRANASVWGDTLLSRKDIPASYHIAVVVDDALQEVTDVARGEDLFMATSLHRLLQSLLGLPAPTYLHHALMRDANGRKLSKSSMAKSIRALREEGYSPAKVVGMLSPDVITAPANS
ncbi:MAG TPA: tRNA glutamyl-Q(34) synthetase GluQRS [Methylocella sp.]|nr:tRNA glutamyl-Q(34) synthetase GluQRS [Methylocella sp.]